MNTSIPPTTRTERISSATSDRLMDLARKLDRASAEHATACYTNVGLTEARENYVAAYDAMRDAIWGLEDGGQR